MAKTKLSKDLLFIDKVRVTPHPAREFRKFLGTKMADELLASVTRFCRRVGEGISNIRRALLSGQRP